MTDTIQDGVAATAEALAEGITLAERHFTEPAIDRRVPEHGLPARVAQAILESEVLLDGDPAKNLATFVTTSMEPEARAVVGTTFTGDCDDVAGIDLMLAELAGRGLDVPMHVDAASGGFVFPFSHPEFAWDFRLPSVQSINVSGHKFGLVYPGIGWLVFR